MDGIINFSEFFKNADKKELPKFDREEILNDFFIEEDIDINETEEVNQEIENVSENLKITEESDLIDRDEVEEMIQKEVERIKKETIAEYKANESKEITLPIIEEEIQEEEEISETNNSEYYKVFNDKAETFSCEIELEGANLKDTQVRLVLESDNWNLMFPGEIDRNGKVTIPIRKLNILEEGLKGTIKMEVIAEGTVFIPWEDDFEVKMSKKVMVKFNENKSTKPKVPLKPAVKVNFKK
jgi:hypothetical protein